MKKTSPPVRLLFHRFTMKQIIRKSALLCLTAGLLTSVASAQTAIYIDNAGFELPNTTKISGGWDVSGANDVPGWSDAGPNSDSGIEQPWNHYHSGNCGSYAMGGQPGAYQITTNTMSWGKKYTLAWWGSESWGGSVGRTSLIRAGATNDAFASTAEVAVSSPTFADYNWAQYTIVYIAGNADVGKYIGIGFRNAGPSGGSWCNWDDFTLTEEDASPAELNPNITTQPVGGSIYEGDSVTFTVAAGGPDLVYQWKAGAPGSGIYTNVPGATNASMTIAYARVGETADYVVYITNAVNFVTSSVAALTVSPATYANGLFNGDFEMPAMGKINGGFDAAGKDAPGWKNAGPNESDSGIDTSPHTGSYCAYVQKGQSGAYQITTNVMHLGDTVTMTWWERNEWQGLAAKVSLLSASSQDAAFGSATTLVSQTNVLGADYDWHSRAITYTAGAGDVGKLVGVALQSADVTTGGWGGFDDLILTVTPAAAAPVIVTQPGSQNDWLASTATLTVVASGSGLSYQWQAGAVGSGIYTNISNGGQFSGANTNSLIIANVAVGNGADYVVIVSNTGGSVTSAPPATLTVNTDAPYFGGMTSKTVYQYDTTTLSPAWVAGGTTFQWQAGAVGGGVYTNLSNGSHFSGVNTTTLTISNVALADGLDYVLVASNAGGTNTSGLATLTVTPVIYVQGFNTDPTNTVSVVGWVADISGGGLSDGGWPGTCLFAAGSTNVPQAFYTTTFLENGSIPGQMAFPVINLTNVTDLTFSMDYDSYWNATSTHTYFAVQMNWGAWYIQSSEVGQAIGNMQTATLAFDPSSSAWNQFTVTGTGTNAADATTTVIGSAATGNLSGYITGVGLVSLHDDTASSAWVKMDNCRITASAYTAVSGLSLASSGGNVVLTWGYGTLVESTNVTGPWTPASGTSPKTVSPTDGSHFYRLRLP